MDSGRIEHRRESEHIAPRGRREEQQVEICRQKSEENIAERKNLTVPDGADSDEDGFTAVRGLNLPIMLPLCKPAISCPAKSRGHPSRLLRRSYAST